MTPTDSAVTDPETVLPEAEADPVMNAIPVPAGPTLSAGFLMPLGLLLAQAVIGVIVGFAAALNGTFGDVGAFLVWAGIGSSLIMLVVSRLVTARQGPLYAVALGWRQTVLPVGRTVWTVVLLFVGIRVSVALYYALFLQGADLEDGGAEQMLQSIFASGMPVQIVVALLYVGAVGPLTEELIFRGYLQTALGNRFGPAVGIGVAALVFALFHGSLVLLPLYFLMGVGFGLALHLTRSLWAAIVLHVMNNILAFGAQLAGWT